MLEFNLKNNEEGFKYLEQIKEMCEMVGSTLEYKEYTTFISIEIHDDNLSAIIKEQNYLKNDYMLWIYHYDNKMAEVRIPMTVIDIIYNIQ